MNCLCHASYVYFWSHLYCMWIGLHYLKVDNWSVETTKRRRCTSWSSKLLDWQGSLWPWWYFSCDWLHVMLWEELSNWKSLEGRLSRWSQANDCRLIKANIWRLLSGSMLYAFASFYRLPNGCHWWDDDHEFLLQCIDIHAWGAFCELVRSLDCFVFLFLYFFLRKDLRPSSKAKSRQGICLLVLIQKWVDCIFRFILPTRFCKTLLRIWIWLAFIIL